MEFDLIYAFSVIFNILADMIAGQVTLPVYNLNYTTSLGDPKSAEFLALARPFCNDVRCCFSCFRRCLLSKQITQRFCIHLRTSMYTHTHTSDVCHLYDLAANLTFQQYSL